MLDASLRGVHPRGIGLGVGEVAVCLPALLAEHAEALLLGVVHADLRRDSIPLKQQRESLVGVRLLLHGVKSGPSIGGAVDLGILVPALGGDASDEGVREDVMG